MKKIYVKSGLKSNLKLNRRRPVHPLLHQGSIRTKIKEQISIRLKQAPRNNAKRLIRTLDPYHEEEIHSGLQSVLQTKDGVDRVKKGYKHVKDLSSTVKRLKTKVTFIKRGKRSRPLYGYRKIKSRGSDKSASAMDNVSRIKTLSSKFVPKNKYGLMPIKTGFKGVISSPAVLLKSAVQQAARKFAAAVVANPKVWLIAGALSLALFLLMSVTNSLGGAASSAGAFFMTDEDNAKQYKATVDELNNNFKQRIDDYKNSGYDDVHIDYMNEDGVLQVSWVEIFALVAVKFEQNLTFSDAQKNYMDYLFDQFTKIKTKTETYYVTRCSADSEGNQHCHDVRKTRLIVQVYTYDMEDVFGTIGLNEDQKEWARRLVASGAIQEQFPDLAGGSPDPSSLTPEELADLMKNLGGNIDKARQEVVKTALTLEGKVSYFWGGKSPAGWNSNWGKLLLVTEPGDDKTGTLQPYGLDCSGFIDWVFKTAGLGNIFSAGGTSYQWSKTYAITMDELQPGDLIFKDIPGQGGVNHIGIFIGKDSNGKNLYIHCQGGTGVIISSYEGFKYPRRPLLFQ